MFVAVYFIVSSILVAKWLIRPSLSILDDEEKEMCGPKSITIPWVYYILEYLVKYNQIHTLTAFIFCGGLALFAIELVVFFIIRAMWIEKHDHDKSDGALAFFAAYVLAEAAIILSIACIVVIIKVGYLLYLIITARKHLRKEGLTEEEINDAMGEQDLKEIVTRTYNKKTNEWEKDPLMEEKLETARKEKMAGTPQQTDWRFPPTKETKP